ncbi:hypothetical protein OH76DRAFT_1490931 [Lentinus brumalis]|uniref:Uncharacterized protein n=1 Tax=Lentinus brumalis TaxID=2498619 RepID=A0A371CHA0_9APHY|nr:hypothetical protein OH76DRAFT_1490931 [Polyporus brumalis]
MPPSRPSRAHSACALPVDSEAARATPTDKVIIERYRNDLVDLPRPAALTVCMRDFYKIDSLARFTDPRLCIYTIGALPVNATWGTSTLERTLCIKNTECALWAIGALDNLSFDTRADCVGCLCVKITLLRECDRLRLANLERRTCPKAKDLRAVQSTMIASVQMPDPHTVFKHLYDATLGFDVQTKLPTLGVNEFVAGDIVLAECRFVRTSYDNWATWSVKFEMTGLTLVHPVPRTQHGTQSRYRGGA